MRQVTLTALKTELQTLADQVGESRFGQAKALYLDKVMVTDEEGTPVAAEDLEVILAPKAAEMADEEEEKAVEEDEEEEKAVAPKAFRPTFRKGLATTAKASAPAIIRPKTYGRLRHFKDDSNGEAVHKAMNFGHWCRAQMGSRKSLDFCDRHGIVSKAHVEGTNSAGGFLVPDEFETELINLREEFGVFRRNSKIVPMTTEVHYLPKRTGTLSVYYPGEATAGTESTQTFAQVTMTAKKAMILTTVSSELQEDAFVNIADDLAGEIAYAFANSEDSQGFTGTGAPFTGLASSLGAAGTHDVTATTGFSDVTNSDVTDLMALLPQYADTPNCKFYMHKSVFHAIFERLFVAANGFSGTEYRAGGQPTILGYPVEFTQVMPSSYTADDIIAYFGDLSLATKFGDRRATEIALSDSGLDAFKQDEIAVRGTERIAIQVHDAGDGSNAGPIVGMKI
jgi:HK97 family phage major capsid protein